jgi:hypothetical protein
LDEYEDNDMFLYGYDIIFKHARPMASKLKTVFLADGTHLKGQHTMWGQDANKHVICMGLSVYFDNESSNTWYRFLHALKMNIPSMDGKDKVVIAGKLCRIVLGLCCFLTLMSLLDVMLTLSLVHIADDSKGFSTAFDSIFESLEQ